VVVHQARRDPKRVVFPEGEHPKVLRATRILLEERIATPVLLGDAERIGERARELDLDLEAVTIVDPSRSERRDSYAEALFSLRQRKGVTRAEALDLLRNPTAFAAMMVRSGDADALVAGICQHYPDTLRPALQIIGTRDDVRRVAGLYMMIVKDQIYFFADTTVNIEPSAEDLAEIAILSAEVARRFHVEPRIAMLSFSNFGSVRHPLADKVRRAVDIVRQRAPELMVDGEMQADTAVSPETFSGLFPFSTLEGGANVLVFPELQSANVAYKLVQRLGGAEAIGPILVGMRHPVHVLQHGHEVKDIVNMAAIAVVDAQELEAGRTPTPAGEGRPREAPVEAS
jgi:malate dehydrogenase (oxaloacetate-decarboxylating)(NADP+)